MSAGKFRNAICYCKDGILNKRKYKNCCMFKDQGYVKDKDGSWRQPTEKEFIKQFRAQQKAKAKLDKIAAAKKKKKEKEMEKTKALIKEITK